eukprot:CAMPEP_0206169478 /NCGR_PEP_ID=MMETSP1474-20131121/35848_1 /ASSEMBLY_ACC=CAM_ASM_001110 /TAXON_ID=97495 /ORGANISM="Imantonia sp., Strain RCC918" /LENGTH=346 /DNA_ID=CAMNT_0053575555 /DNA_START=22 /DNA_END=1059 /DNA_ORIENTATION=+
MATRSDDGHVLMVFLGSLFASLVVIFVTCACAAVRTRKQQEKHSNWDAVRATIFHELRQQPHVVDSLTVKLWVAMLVVRSMMRHEEAQAELNAASSHHRFHPFARFESWSARLLAPLRRSKRARRRSRDSSSSDSSVPPPPPDGHVGVYKAPPTTKPSAISSSAGSVAGDGSLPASAAEFCHTWRPVEDDNYEAYLRVLGLSWSLRKLAATMRPEPTFSIEDGVLHAHTPGLGGQTMHDVFSTGGEKTIAMMGRHVQVSYRWDGSGALVATMRAADGELAGGQTITIRRWVEDGRLYARSSCGEVTSTRRYERVEPHGVISPPRTPELKATPPPEAEPNGNATCDL